MAAKTAVSVAPTNPFIKQLGANDRQVRDRAISSLRTYLSRSTPFTPLDLLKLHKGLFFALWSADKPLYQQSLSRTLASLALPPLSTANFLAWTSAFWTTMAREWGGIDRLRMDKFLFMMREVVRTGFERLAGEGWESGLVEGYVGCLAQGMGPLTPREVKVPNGIRHHVLDVWVDELEKVDGKEGKAPIEEVLKPVRALGRDTVVKSVRERVGEVLKDERLKAWGVEVEGGDAEEDDEELSEIDEEMDDEDDEEEEDGGEFGGFDD